MGLTTWGHSAPPRPDSSAPDVDLTDDSRAEHTPRLGYMPALDGIRAIAVLAVMIFHSAVDWLPGGFLGVDVFFVLSGFLITSLLLAEVERSGAIDFGQFYLRRARRLLPALFVVLAATAVLVLVFAHDAAAKFREDAIASLLYVTNWWNILGNQSYFETMGRPPLLQHLWSLGIEEQFYLFWPLILLVVFRKQRRNGVRKAALIGIAVSTILMAVLSFVWAMPTDNDPSRLYFGTDTHAMTILAGAALATVWRPSALPRNLANGPKWILTGIGIAATLAIVWCFINVDDASSFLYRGGFTIFAGLCVVMVAVFSHPSINSVILSSKPMVYIGQRSYGLYLWHWPIFMVTRPGIDVGLTGVSDLILQFALTFGAAELSYRYIEMPIRNGALKRIWNSWRHLGPGVAAKRLLAAITATTVLIFGLAVGVSAIPATDANTYLDGATEVGAGDLATETMPELTPAKPKAQKSQGSETAAGTTEPSPAAVPTTTGTGTAATTPITLVGDSVMLGSRVALTEAMPKGTIDAAVSRHAADMYRRVKERRTAGKLANIVVIHPGTNGPAYEDDLRKAVAGLSDRTRVILVTTHVPRKWMDQSNESVQKIAAEFPNVRIADWTATSQGHREYFVPDGIHLTAPGARAYAATIAQAIDAP